MGKWCCVFVLVLFELVCYVYVLFVGSVVFLFRFEYDVF